MSPQVFGVPDLSSKADHLQGVHFSAELCSGVPGLFAFYVFLCLRVLMRFFRSEFSPRVTLVLMQWVLYHLFSSRQDLIFSSASTTCCIRLQDFCLFFTLTFKKKTTRTQLILHSSLYFHWAQKMWMCELRESSSFGRSAKLSSKRIRRICSLSSSEG